MRLLLSILSITIVGGMGGVLLYAGLKDWAEISRQGLTKITTPFRVPVAIVEIVAGFIALFFTVTQIIALIMQLASV